jgi:hypothetical protein
MIISSIYLFRINLSKLNIKNCLTVNDGWVALFFLPLTVSPERKEGPLADNYELP